MIALITDRQLLLSDIILFRIYDFNPLKQGWAIFSLPRAALAIHIFVEGRRKN
jgi:hypothetical protein